MPSTEHSKPQNGRFVERLLSAAGGAILAGSLGIWIFGYFKDAIPNELIAFIAGAAGGGIAIAQRRWARRKKWGEKE